MKPQETPKTYKVVATFEAKDGSGRQKRRTIARGVDIWDAIQAKTSIVSRVSHCVGAACYPEGVQ